MDTNTNETVEMQTQENLMEIGVLRSNGVLPKPQRKGLLFRTWARYVNNDQSWLEKQRGILILAALVVAGMAFHSGINPPGGTITNTQNNRYELGNAVQTEVDMDQFNSFVMYNTFTMILSLAIVLLLISGFSLRNKFLMWVLTIATLFAVVFIVATYLQSLAMMAPDMYVDVTSDNSLRMTFPSSFVFTGS
ncbi:Ankyrin repeat-containing protein [Artemisia annua]|uniref:Ankyrin repeat-containing protein n=1 Tax=Artemisia annua TaxID=35608 RepID=A0A2U1LVJ7_ARTAN|nr:Ankyrin repeat-containing protein [Artemisia annua]